MMCRYCKDGKQAPIVDEYEAMQVYVTHLDGDDYVLMAYPDGEDTEAGCFAINFCPMCGRDLRRAGI